jgi:hypothetical protein
MTIEYMKGEERKRGTVAYWLGKEVFLMAPGTTKHLCATLDGSLYLRYTPPPFSPQLDIAGNILLKILPQLDGRSGVTLLVV